MRIIDCSADSGLACVGQALPKDAALPADIAAEHRLDVYINERRAMRLTCTPEHLDELAVGRLLTEGLIARAADIEQLYICEQGLRAKVQLCGDAAAKLRETAVEIVGTCCTDNRILMEGSLPDAPIVPIGWEPAWLTAMADFLKRSQPLYASTHALHACCLAAAGRPLCVREDIGRHNALDKAIGWALINGIDLSECLLFTTGRMPADMVVKALRAGTPVLASKTYPTDRGVALARQYGLTLVTLRPDGELLIWADGQSVPEED